MTQQLVEEEAIPRSEPYLSRRSSTIDIIPDDDGIARMALTSEVLHTTYITISVLAHKR